MACEAFKIGYEAKIRQYIQLSVFPGKIKIARPRQKSFPFVQERRVR